MAISRFDPMRNKAGTMIKHCDGTYVEYEEHISRMRTKEAQLAAKNKQLETLQRNIDELNEIIRLQESCNA